MAKGTIAIHDDDFDPTPMLHWLLAMAIGLAAWVAVFLIIAALLTPAQAADYRVVTVRGNAIYYPTRAIERRVLARLPTDDYVEVGSAKIRQMCGHSSSDVYGCTAIIAGVPWLVYIRRGLPADLKRAVLVHEMAHYWYGWQHP